MRTENVVKRFACTALVLATAVFGVAPANAQDVKDVSITLGNAFVTPGGMGTIDVFLSPDSGTVNVDEFQVEFGISGGSIPGSDLYFTVDTSAEDFVLNDSDYLFAGNVGGAPITPISDAADQNLPVNTPLDGPPILEVSAFDITSAPAFGTVFLDVPRLLTRLQFQHTLDGISPLASVGDSFQISLAPDAFINDSNGINHYDLGPLVSGTVTVVPEPGTFAACAAFTGLVALRRRRRQ